MIVLDPLRADRSDLFGSCQSISCSRHARAVKGLNAVARTCFVFPILMRSAIVRAVICLPVPFLNRKRKWFYAALQLIWLRFVGRHWHVKAQFSVACVITSHCLCLMKYAALHTFFINIFIHQITIFWTFLFTNSVVEKIFFLNESAWLFMIFVLAKTTVRCRFTEDSCSAVSTQNCCFGC